MEGLDLGLIEVAEGELNRPVLVRLSRCSSELDCIPIVHNEGLDEFIRICGHIVDLEEEEV